jgi:formylglycine-generating enzyme required for sulfatase activity
VVTSASRTLIPATVDGFSRAWLSSRREGNVDCIASLPRLLETSLQGDSLFFRAARGTKIVVTAGNPAYDRPAAEFTVGPHAISLYRAFGRYEGKFVVQLFDGAELLDERIETVELGTPRLVSAAEPTRRASSKPEGMTELPAGRFTFAVAPTDVPNPVIPYPDHATPREVLMPRLYIDTYPVTNAQFQRFLQESHYRPKDTTNFLRHWMHGRMPREFANHPVVWVSLEDARAYARWSGKRLPSGIEWQYAAQGTDGRTYPWGRTFDSTCCNNGRGHTTPVDAYPSGKSPFGVMDMVGNVWQLTNDTYDNGSYYYVTMRGGSYYNPSSSIWYVQGGPWSVNREQMLLLLSPGFDRSATVGFRCVKDADAVPPPSGERRP